MSAVTSLFKTPKPTPLPPVPKQETIAQAGQRERRKLQREKTQTILTSGQGVAPAQQQKRTLLGGN